jgi:hypothetical protein
MIFVPALVGAFLPQTQSAIFKKYAVLPPARDEKTHPSNDLSEVAARIFLCLEFVNIL